MTKKQKSVFGYMHYRTKRSEAYVCTFVFWGFSNLNMYQYLFRKFKASDLWSFKLKCTSPSYPRPLRSLSNNITMCYICVSSSHLVELNLWIGNFPPSIRSPANHPYICTYVNMQIDKNLHLFINLSLIFFSLCHFIVCMTISTWCLKICLQNMIHRFFGVSSCHIIYMYVTYVAAYDKTKIFFCKVQKSGSNY